MRSVLLVLAILATAAFAGNVRLDRPLPVSGTDDLFQYDDGTANWLTWGGLYRGTWFNLQDFVPGAPGGQLNNLEYWFFHHASYPWDVSSFYAELYDGDAAAPVTQLNQTSVVATHYSPVYATYGTPIAVGADFWGLINTEMSAGGWPSVLGDNTPNPTSHSFFSDDFIVWEPWVIAGATANDYFVRSTGTIGLDQSTWGAIKGLYN
jgi:hypothetical protein